MMKYLQTGLVLAISSLGSTLEAANKTGCAAIAQAAGSRRACVDTPHGIVIAGSRERAAGLGMLAIQGEKRFVLHFRTTVPRYAVVEMTAAEVDEGLDTALKEAGYAWRLPWLSERATADAYRSSITRAVEAGAGALHLDAAQTAQLTSAALAQQAGKLAPAALRDKEAGALPHELGHGWFIKAYWPDANAGSGDHYGGPSPDWMDETAAIMMENDALADQRRARFAAIYHGPDPARATLVDLTMFLSGGHPALPALDLPAGAGRVRVLTGEEGAAIAAVAGTFYLQARLFADYVIDRSGDPAAFRSAAARFARGQTIAQWLASDGSKLHLPTDLAAVQRDWEAWLAATLGGGPSRS